MRIELADSDDWEPSRFHGRELAAEDEDWNHWRVLDEGILVFGEGDVRRSPGEPLLMRKVVEAHADIILACADRFAVSEQFLAALVATQSRGDERAENLDERAKDWGIGLAKMRTATARKTARSRPHEFPTVTPEPVPAGGAPEVWRGILRDPTTALALAAAWARDASARLDLRGDPLLLFCAYQTGGLSEADNAWGVAHHRQLEDGVVVSDSLDDFAAWYGDACAVYGLC